MFVFKIKGNKIWITAIAILFAVTLTTTVIHIFRNNSDNNNILSQAASTKAETSINTFRINVIGMR